MITQAKTRRNKRQTQWNKAAQRLSSEVQQKALAGHLATAGKLQARMLELIPMLSPDTRKEVTQQLAVLWEHVERTDGPK
tara:strand:- start:811 stop:1050 length:240 start_codon:yes stop_codon:yes gene_type:complete